MTKKLRVLVIGDGGVSTGFAKCVHNYCDALLKQFEVILLALNYHGDPNPWQSKYPMYPTRTFSTGDYMGWARMPELIAKHRPDVILVVTDPWFVPTYVQQAGNVPVVAIVAVDSKNCQGTKLNGAKHVIFWTEFGKQEAERGGYTGSSSVLPLGVDLQTFAPVERSIARKNVGWPEEYAEGFIVGIAGRNQPRKNMDLAVMYFAEWVRRNDIHDAFLMCHTAPTGDVGYDIPQLSMAMNIANKLMIFDGDVGMGVSERTLVNRFCAMDVLLSLSMEGWGLCQMESMACGVGNAVSDWSALGEWPEDTVVKIPCTSSKAMQSTNGIGGIADREATIQVLDDLYRDRALLADYAARGRALVQRPEFRWENIGTRLVDILEHAMVPRLLAGAEVG